jgi:8-oxo-dGTP diphosphatase
MKTIQVVAAIIVEEGRLFATQRGYGDFKDYWEFPGGKIEPGETPEEALRREILEELDTDIEVGNLLTTVEYDYPQFHLKLHCFRCRIIDGKLQLKEHEDAVWIELDRLEELNWLPADFQILSLLE